jgi:hypothetical protein
VGQQEAPSTEQPDEPMAQSRSANQIQDEPIPASRHDEKRQAGVVRNEEAAAASGPEGRPDPGGDDSAA